MDSMMGEAWQGRILLPTAGIPSKMDNTYLFRSLYKPTSVLDILLTVRFETKKSPVKAPVYFKVLKGTLNGFCG